MPLKTVNPNTERSWILQHLPEEAKNMPGYREALARRNSTSPHSYYEEARFRAVLQGQAAKWDEAPEEARLNLVWRYWGEVDPFDSYYEWGCAPDDCQLCTSRSITHFYKIRHQATGQTLRICCICARMFGLPKSDTLDVGSEALKAAARHVKCIELGLYPTVELREILDQNLRTGLWPDNIVEILARADVDAYNRYIQTVGAEMTYSRLAEKN